MPARARPVSPRERRPPCSTPPLRRQGTFPAPAARRADLEPMAIVSFLVHPDRPDALELATQTAEWLTGRGDQARILRFSGPDTVSEAGVDVELGAVDLS